jgi:hypothetical protein
MSPDPSPEDVAPGATGGRMPPRRQPLATVALLCLLVAAGALALLAGTSLSHAGATPGAHAAGSASTSTATDTADTSTTAAAQTATTALAGAEGTPTVAPYTGPNYMSAVYDTSSCHPGAISPYPYLDVYNNSQDTAMAWKLSLSDSAYSVWKSPPNPIQAGLSDYFAFVGPMTAKGPLYVSFSGGIGSWSGTLQPCAVAPPPTPTDSPTAPPNYPPTPAPMDITVTCAQATAGVSGELCIHTKPGATVTLDSIGYLCSGNGESSYAIFGARVADSNGDYTWNWVPHTSCQGQATASISAQWVDLSTGYRYQGSLTTTFDVQ